MAKKEERKRQKKRKQEKLKAARNRSYLATQAKSRQYPQIIIDPTGGDPSFVAEVRRLVETFSFDDPNCCDAIMQHNYKLLAALGPQGWARHSFQGIRSAATSLAQAENINEQHQIGMYSHFGQWIFSRLPQQFKSEFSLRTFFRVDLEDRGMVIHFALFDEVREPGHRLYLLPGQPTVPMSGVNWIVGLYSHAAKRICNRLYTGQPLVYTTYVDLYFRLSMRWLVFEPLTLHDGQEAARVLFELPLTTAHFTYFADYARQILGLSPEHRFEARDKLFAVLGYLPLVFQGRYARAKTFLLPGFVKTPEFTLARQKATTRSEQVALEAMTDESRRTDDLQGSTVAAIKWYHDNGVPQIFPRDRPSTAAER